MAPRSTRAGTINVRHRMQEEVVAFAVQCRAPKDVRAADFTDPIRIDRAGDQLSCSVEAVLDFCIRLGDECVEELCTRTASGSDARRYGRWLLTVPGRTDPERAATSEAVAQVCVDAGVVSRADVRNLGPGKVIRKYATTALRSLQPLLPRAPDAALDARHLHTRAVWSAAYKCEPFAPLQAAVNALTDEQRAALTVERALRLHSE